MEPLLPERASRHHHPAAHRRPEGGRAARFRPVQLPSNEKDVTLEFGGRAVRLTNLTKLFWRERGHTKRDLLQYYADVAPLLLPHLRDRAMVMRRYPDGAEGSHFFMKRTPPGKPEWLQQCSIRHGSGNVIDFPVVADLPSLLWVVNLGCIDLNQWYARCDDVDRPDYLHFDLDPGKGVAFDRVRDATLLIEDALQSLEMPVFAKTTGSRGVHLYVPIERGPTQKEVWTVAKAIAGELASRHPKLLTAEYRIRSRPVGRVLVDYNQNAWGRTLASVYSVRPTPFAGVSMPVTRDELEAGVTPADFRLDNARERLREVGDMWAPLAGASGPRFELRSLL